MFINEKFIFLHIPKTGGTFVQFHLRKIYAKTLFRKLAHSLRSKYGIVLPFMRYNYLELPKHTLRREMNNLEENIPIILCIRNPFDVFISQYKFRWWQKFPDKWFADPQQVVARFGEISRFNFETFVRATLAYSHWTEKAPSTRKLLGPLSAEWIRYFARDPSSCISCISDDELENRVRAELASMTLLRTETLAEDFCNFLRPLGICPAALENIMSSNAIFPGPQTRFSEDRKELYFTAELTKELLEAEWLLFRLFPDYQPEEASDAASAGQTKDGTTKRFTVA